VTISQASKEQAVLGLPHFICTVLNYCKIQAREHPENATENNQAGLYPCEMVILSAFKYQKGLE